jgi:hypothetical protein
MTTGTQIPVIVEQPLTTCGCKKFQLDTLADHPCTCTTHSGAKKAHDWAIDQLADLFYTIHNMKTQNTMRRSIIVFMMLDLRIAHDRFGSSSDPNLNGHLHCPNDIDRSLNETVVDKIRKYRSDYNNNPPNAISFMPAITGTSGRLHGEFVRLLFLQDHRETDRFFADSGVQLNS